MTKSHPRPHRHDRADVLRERGLKRRKRLSRHRDLRGIALLRRKACPGLSQESMRERWRRLLKRLSLRQSVVPRPGRGHDSALPRLLRSGGKRTLAPSRMTMSSNLAALHQQLVRLIQSVGGRPWVHHDPQPLRVTLSAGTVSYEDEPMS